MAEITCVVFDIGRVAAYSGEYERLAKARERWGATFSAHDFRRMMHPNLGDGVDYWRRFQNGEISTTTYLSAAVQAVGLPDTVEERAHFATCLQCMFGRAYQPLLDLAQHLREEYQIIIGVLTNNNEIMCQTPAYTIAHYADVTLSSHQIHVSKPHPEAYIILLNELNRFVKIPQLKTELILFIDDKLENVEAARKLGMQGFVFPSREKEMDDAFSDLLDFLSKLGITKGVAQSDNENDNNIKRS